MLEAVVLLAPDDVLEHAAQYLSAVRPELIIVPVSSEATLRALPATLLAKSRLIAFTSPIIVPAAILRALGYGAYNFHPGPPTYPGLAPAQFAIYDGATVFGATVHAMVEKVDAGPIVAMELCMIAPHATVFDIELQAFTRLVTMFKTLAPHLTRDPAPLPRLPVTWATGKSSRQSLAAICDIPLDIAAGELDRRIRAFASNHFGVQPTVTLHGHTFVYVSSKAGEEADVRPAGNPQTDLPINSPAPAQEPGAIQHALA